MAITRLDQTSIGAPASFNGSIGSLIALLDFCLVTTLGWTKIAGTNEASYHSNAGNGRWLAVSDTTTLTARVRMFDTMTDAGVAVANGTNPVPNNTQLSGGGYVYKSGDTTTNQPWMFLSDGKSFYLTWNYYTAVGRYNGFFFGDFVSYRTGDTFNTALICDTTTSAPTNFPVISIATGTTCAGHWIAGSATQVAVSTPVGKSANPLFSTVTRMGTGGATYPSSVEGALLLSPVFIVEPGNSVRGRLPGLFNPLHNTVGMSGLSANDTFSGSGELAGRNFEARGFSTSTNYGMAIFETTDNWGA